MQLTKCCIILGEANISDLGLDKSEAYNFLITSSQRQGTSQGVYANGWMRTDLNNSTFKLTPNLVKKTGNKNSRDTV
ncbi:hypothetical protein ACVXZY_01465 [Staphylococcus aureus]